ncbi:MAG: polysaccharide biosynthesis protein [Halobacteriovoraceae bacterium]|nr:polysaccharide biosynthesis protein [Halobacteriovoraceae bacterium]
MKFLGLLSAKYAYFLDFMFLAGSYLFFFDNFTFDRAFVYTGVTLFVNHFFNIYKIHWSLFSFNNLENHFLSMIGSVGFLLIYNASIDAKSLTVSQVLITHFSGHCVLLALRFVSRWGHFKLRDLKTGKQKNRKILCYGSEKATLGFIDFVLKGPLRTFEIVGFLDDNIENVGHYIHNKKILGTLKNIEDVAIKYKVTDVVISSSRVAPEKISEVLQVCFKLGLKVTRIQENILPDGRSGISNVLRPLNLEDLLERKRVQVDLLDFKNEIQKKAVIVTGAGGSIGSEIARQVLDKEPAQVYLIEHSEYNLFKIFNELQEEYPSLKKRIIPVLLGIENEDQVQEIFEEIKPDVVFHAAAYKHVHLLEMNPFSAIINNINGTLNVLKHAAQNGVNKFVLISTDKAVNPTSVMGASKRICELLVSSYARKFNESTFCSVRFGNVLGSSGSLIPILEEKIINNQPLTITDERMKRYFMLIPEAVSLVLKASMIAESGDILVLKMGEPVKILDIAKKLLLLKGKSEQEVPLIFTGMKKGEKLVEELYLKGDELNTTHEDILVLPESRDRQFKNVIERTEQYAIEMIELALNNDARAIEMLWTLLENEISHKEIKFEKAI